MSVLNQSGEEQVECPLCMEPLEVDDLNFFPCTCGYQICRFCWHRIRTDENGLCPACRKAYSENPADFIPLSKEQVAQLKAEKRQRDQQRKAKLSESRKHLASVRVVQRNLVFVVGLPMRLADPEVLKKHEYFGKFGKIHKVVINQSTAYAGTQGPSASAYVTYMKSDDALRAIQSVNNSTLDGKTIKTSLGTTKYCSHFMKNQPCPKPDCMYLHDFGDQEASFTKEQMHAGKHQEYEKKLHDCLLAKLAAAQQQQQAAAAANHTTTHHAEPTTKAGGKAKDAGKEHTNGKDASAAGTWPQLDKEKDKDTGKCKADGKDKPEKSKRNKKSNVGENNSKNKARSEDSCNRDKDKDKEKEREEKKDRTAPSEKDRSRECKDDSGKEVGKSKEQKIKEKERERESRASGKGAQDVADVASTNDGALADDAVLLVKEASSPGALSQQSGDEDKTPPPPSPPQRGRPAAAAAAHDDNSSFFTSNSFSCAKQLDDDDEGSTSSLLGRQIDGQDLLLDIHDGDAWDFDFGYINHSQHLEELATQRCRQQEQPKDALESFANGFGGLDTFSKLDAFADAPYMPNTESLLETLAKSSVSYQMHPQHRPHQQQAPPQQQQPPPPQHYMNGHSGHKETALLSGILELQQQQRAQDMQAQQKLLDMYRSLQPQQMGHQVMNGLHSQSNGFHGSFAPPPPPQQQQHHYNHLNMLDKRMALLQQRQMEENFLNLTLGKQMSHQQPPPPQQPQPHAFGQMNGHAFDAFGSSMGGSFGLGQSAQGAAGAAQKRHVVVDDKDLDFRFQEAQKALEALVESDSHVHNSGRTTLGSNQLNGLVHSQSGSHLPPPPPGFVQPNTHMNSFGSKILPFLNMNSQQQQQQQQINTSQNNWPSNFSQIQQQQQQNQHKGMGGVCNDWKVLDTAIISSRRHIPSMGPLIDQYAPGAPSPSALQQQQQQQAAAAAAQQQRTYDMYTTFSNYSSQLPPAYGNGYQTHLGAQPNLGWLGGELGAPISTPPGFRAAGQATKQQEC